MSKLTKKAIAESTRELLKEKDISKITVKEITDRIGMTRNTFYYHFTDIYDVVNYIILDEADSIFAEFPKDDDWEKTFREALEFLHDNKKMINHVYYSVSHINLDKYIRDVVGNYTLKIVDKMVGDTTSVEAKKIVADFYQNGFVGVILQWILDDMKTPPEQLAVLCDSMLNGTIESTITSAETAINIITKM